VTVGGREIRMTGHVPWHDSLTTWCVEEGAGCSACVRALDINWPVKSDMTYVTSQQCSVHVFTVVCMEKHAPLQCRHQSNMPPCGVLMMHLRQMPLNHFTSPCRCALK